MSCLSEQIANALSTMTIMSCMFLKVPQIMQVRRAKCADGLYLQAMVMEILSFTTMTLYNFANGYGILTYLEYPIILLQVYIMVYYVLLYSNKLYKPIVILASIAYAIAVLCFAMEFLPKDILDYLVPLCTPLSGFAKVTYMYGIIATCNADAVSLLTWIISVATNLSRVYTVYVDSEDIKLMTNFTISAFLSTGVLVTAMIYKYRPPRPGCNCSSPPRRRRKSHCD